MSLDLRPLTLGELLDRSFSLYRRHFWLFVGIMALPSLLGLAFGLVVALFNPQPVGPGSVAADANPAAILGAILWFAAAMIGMLAVYFITYAVALGATTVAVSQLYMGRPTSIREAYVPLRGRVGRLALLLLLISIRLFGIMFLGFAAFGVAAALGAAGSPVLAALAGFFGFAGAVLLWVWSALRYAVAVPAAVLEDETATDAIRRSIELTRGSLLRVLVLLVFTMVITYAVLAVFQGPFMIAIALAGPDSSTFFWMNLLGTITGSLGGALTAPLMIVAFAVLYYDLRVRNEGLDLQLMLAGLEPAGGSHVPPSPALLPGQGQ
jgi:hypothetical protein